ncbi:Protein kinase-like domain containing protein, partial [Amanita muscaria]
VGGKYRIRKQIGAGSFGAIYTGYNTTSGEEVTIKLESRSAGYLHLENECKAYLNLGNRYVGIPRMKWSGIEGDYTILTLSLLGPSLEEIFASNNRKLNLTTILVIADQLISCIEYIHSCHLVHRDLKPDNLLVGLGPHSHRIHIIDFGLAKQYRDPQTNIHIHYRDNLPMIGTARYSSINAQTGIGISRRDDIESIAYILIYFMCGSLPWQGDKGGKRKADVRKKKLTTSPQELCAGLPAEFELCLQYARSLGFSERPDYHYLRELFLNL